MYAESVLLQDVNFCEMGSGKARRAGFSEVSVCLSPSDSSCSVGQKRKLHLDPGQFKSTFLTSRSRDFSRDAEPPAARGA